jgi:hypothetical protein
MTFVITKLKNSPENNYSINYASVIGMSTWE